MSATRQKCRADISKKNVVSTCQTTCRQRHLEDMLLSRHARHVNNMSLTTFQRHVVIMSCQQLVIEDIFTTCRLNVMWEICIY